MNSKILSFKNILTLFICVTLAGCATKTQVTNTGFLNDYTDFTEREEYKDILIHETPGESLALYSKYLIERPIIKIDVTKEENIGIKDEKLEDLINYFEEKLKEYIGEEQTITSNPGPGVVRIRTAITDISASSPLLNIHWVTKLSKSGVGGASLEAEFVDSITDKQIVGIIDARQGRGLQYHKGFSKWGYTKDTLLQWSRILAQYINDQNANDL